MYQQSKAQPHTLTLWFGLQVLIFLSAYNKLNTRVLVFLIPLRNEELFFSLLGDDNVTKYTFNALQP